MKKYIKPEMKFTNWSLHRYWQALALQMLTKRNLGRDMAHPNRG